MLEAYGSERLWGSFVYRVLVHCAGSFPWKKSVWQVPPRVAFFTWTASLGKILTTDNLRRMNIMLMSWCCMCKADGLFLHCAIAQDLWDMIFSLFGLHWAMPQQVTDLLACWQGRLGRNRHYVIWQANPHCVLWCLWRERNARTFKGCKRNILELRVVNGIH